MKAVATREIQRHYDRIAWIYDLVELPMEWLWFRTWRRSTFRWVEGERWLEVGIGTGKNLPYHPAGGEAVGVDLSPGMLGQARRRKNEGPLDLALMDVQALGFKSRTFDTVIATLVFCAVPDPVQGLREVRRVLKPNGRAVFLEHVRPGGRWRGGLFDLLNLLTRYLFGCHLNRPTAENIRKAGFEIEREECLSAHVVKLIVAQPEDR